MTTIDDTYRLKAGEFSSAMLCAAHPGVQAVSSRIRPICVEGRLFGRARTVRMSPGQNAALHRAVHVGGPGDVLVVDAGGSRNHGAFGELLMTAAKARGIRGLVIDGCVRDIEEIRTSGFPIFALGTHPGQTDKSEGGEVDVEITCGSAVVRPGDTIVGDGDGVVVVPRDLVSDVAVRAAAVERWEEVVVAQLRAGQSTWEAMELDALASAAGADPQNRRPPRFFNLRDRSLGRPRHLAEGVEARVFTGRGSMLSVVTLAPHAVGAVHEHVEEQWGVLIEGSAVRIQDGEEVPVTPGDFWHTPGGVPHGVRAGPSGALILDVFSPSRAAYLD